MGTLTIVKVDSEVDADAVTQEATYETREHPEGREDADGNDIGGQSYEDLVDPERRGTVAFTVTAEASGFAAGERAQIDISAAEGYRAAAIVDLPEGDDPQEVTVTFDPADLHTTHGLITVLAFAVDADGNLIGEPSVNADGLQSWQELARYTQ